MSVGIPVKLLHEGIGHTISIELKSGLLYRGTLVYAEDNMNCLLEKATLVKRDGKQLLLEQVYIRGGSVAFFIFPDMLKYSPIFKINKGKGKTTFATIRRAIQIHTKMSPHKIK